jgi:hypothetical protein
MLLIGATMFAAIVDRTAITVGPKVITDSEITRRIRLAAFQNGQLPEFNDKTRREAAQRLVDLKLVEREMDLGHYVRATPDKAKTLMDAFTAEHFRSSPEALRIALSTMNLTTDDLLAEFAEQADLLTFTTLRFRPAVDVSEQDIEAYYHSQMEGKTNPLMSLADARATIEETLMSERTDKALDAWLKDQRTRTRIVYLEKELE